MENRQSYTRGCWQRGEADMLLAVYQWSPFAGLFRSSIPSLTVLGMANTNDAHWKQLFLGIAVPTWECVGSDVKTTKLDGPWPKLV
jgi:hypothetical protein